MSSHIRSGGSGEVHSLTLSRFARLAMRFSPARLPTRARSLCFRPKQPKRSWTTGAAARDE